MRDRPWYKRYPADFLNGVEGIGPAAIGCYAVVLDMIYDRGAPIPNDARLIGGRLGCSARLARSLIDDLVGRNKLLITPHGLSNMRAEVEMRRQELNRLNLAENGAKGGRKRAQNAGDRLHFNGIAQARLNHRAPVQRPDIREPFPTPSRAQAEKQERGSAERKEEGSPSVALIVSQTLAARFTNRRTG